MSIQPPEGLQDQTVPQLATPLPSQVQQQPSNELPPELRKVVNSYDNHVIHIMMHNRFRKSQQFEMLPDMTKKIFEDHVQQHQLALQAGMTPQNNAGMIEMQAQQQGQQAPQQGQQVPIQQDSGVLG